MPPPVPLAAADAAAAAPPGVVTELATVGRVAVGVDGVDETTGPIGRCGREIPALLLGVEMLGDMVGRRAILDG